MDGSDEGWRGKRRHRLLAAAARVFARHVYAQASMDEIAHEAQVGKPTLYRYFPSKEALFAAVFSHALDELEDRMETLLAGKAGIEAQLSALVAAMLPTVRDHLVPLRFLGEEGALADQSKRRVFRERRARIAGLMERAIADGVRNGEVRPVHAARASNFIIGMIWSGSAVTRADEDEALASEIVGIVLRGMLQPETLRADAPPEPSSWRHRLQDVPANDLPAQHQPASHQPAQNLPLRHLPGDPDRTGRHPSTVRPREATS